MFITGMAAGLKRKAHNVAQRSEDLQRKAGTAADSCTSADSPKNFSYKLNHLDLYDNYLRSPFSVAASFNAL